MTYPPKIIAWANIIEQFEGWFRPSLAYPFGSCSYRNLNPFNMRYGAYAISLGAIGRSPMGYAKFPNYQTGFDAGCQLLVDACSGKLPAYNPSLGLLAFYQVFAPASDGNNPDTYAAFVAAKLQTKVDIPISSFLS